MNLLNRVMSYDKTKVENQEICNCEECVLKTKSISVRIKGIDLFDDFLKKLENYQIMCREHKVLNIINLKYWYKNIKTKTFIWKSLFIHDNKYDYSRVEYINCKTKVYIKCKKHNYYFWQAPTKHLSGHNCPFCAVEKGKIPPKLSLEKFIQQSKIIHGNKYDYSKVDYKNARTKVIIICLNHDKPYEFVQTPESHLRGQGCPKCGGKLKLTTEEFIEQSNQVHGVGRYDYSKVNYKNAKTKVLIICHNHNEPFEFLQDPHSHLQGHGCPKCARELQSKEQSMTFDEFIKEAKNVQGEGRYDYSKVDFINGTTKILIICHNHDEPFEFLQIPREHLQGKGCPKCAGTLKSTIEEFIEKANIKQGKGTYDYSEAEYIDAKTKIKIICPKHGAFWQTPNNHLRGKGCPKCNSSQGAKKVRLFLIKNNIEFEEEKRFSDCKDKRSLPFDFYIPLYNLCIEYDGKQHFSPTTFGSKTMTEDRKLENLKYVQKHDQIKNDYCKQKGINLLRLNNLKTVEQELTEYFKTYKINDI